MPASNLPASFFVRHAGMYLAGIQKHGMCFLFLSFVDPGYEHTGVTFFKKHNYSFFPFVSFVLFVVINPGLN